MVVAALRNVRSRGQSGKHLLALSFSGFETRFGRRPPNGTGPPGERRIGRRYAISLRHLSVHLGSQHHTFLSSRFITRADEYRRVRASIHGDVQHVCGNEDVISWPHDVSILELIASPQLHLIAAEPVESRFVMLVHVRAGSFPGRQGYHSEPNRFRADGFRAYPGLVIAALLGAIARAALDHERFLRGSNSIVAGPGCLKDSHGNLLFGMWLEALSFFGQPPSSGRDVEPMPTDPDSAKAALDRIVIPQDVLDRIAGIAPRSSLIVTDEALSSETSKGTDFVMLLSGEPQGGIKSRRRSPGTEFHYARPRDRLFYWRSPFGSWFSTW
jgi:hypothetical protein